MTDPPPTRKPYRITKQREKWTDAEHQRFTEAVEKYGRDWKQIVEHVGTRSVAQVRSHAQKFFLKLEKAGQAAVVPPPRPKKRAAKPYPVQDRSEERRKSKRSRTTTSNSSAHSQPSHTRRGPPSPSSTPSNGRSSPRSAATATTLPTSSRRPVSASTRTTRSLANVGSKGSSQDLEGNGSNIASANESNNDNSEGPSATQENSGLSTGAADLNLHFSAHPATSFDVPEAVLSTGGKCEAPDYNKLLTVMNAFHDSGGAANDEKTHKQMMEQLEPEQREELLAMMDKVTGNLRSTFLPPQKLEQLKAELKAKSCSPTLPQPGAPPVRTLRLDNAASMPLMPSTACLPMPQTVSEEPLALMQPLPGSQGTALLQPLPCAQQCSFSPVLPPPLADACELLPCGSGAGSSSIGCGISGTPATAVLAGAEPADAALLQQGEPEQSIADQLLADGAEEPAGMGPTLFDIQQSSELDDSALQLPKQSRLGGNTPLDTCLAQLESGAEPNVPESDDFLDSWKIGSSDPVWQTLEMQQPSPAAPTSPSSFTRDTNGSMFVF